MNREGRDEVRHKHRKLWDGSPVVRIQCAWCRIPYPCDTIQVLDAWEARELEWAYDYLIKSGVHK
jgi:hypothetical protein